MQGPSKEVHVTVCKTRSTTLPGTTKSERYTFQRRADHCSGLDHLAVQGLALAADIRNSGETRGTSRHGVTQKHSRVHESAYNNKFEVASVATFGMYQGAASTAHKA